MKDWLGLIRKDHKLRNTHAFFNPNPSSMLASRTSTVRNVQRIARSFATVVDTTGVKVAAVDYNQPTSSVTVLVKAGSRFEPKQGVANALKNFAFKVCHDSDIYGPILKRKRPEYCQ